MLVLFLLKTIKYDVLSAKHYQQTTQTQTTPTNKLKNAKNKTFLRKDKA